MILLDTCTLLWLACNPCPMPPEVQERIRRSAVGERFCSAMSALEVGTKHARGRLKLPLVPRLWLEKHCASRGIEILPITATIAMRSTELPWHHRDPADRIILSTALEHHLTILSPDTVFRAYDVSTFW